MAAVVPPLCTSLLMLASWGLAAQPEISVLEAPATRMEDTRHPRQALVVRWSGGEVATVEARRGDRWIALGREVPSPFLTTRVPVGTAIRVVTADGTSGEGRAPGVWSPSDIAGWSGPGLRGARAVQLEEAGGVLWATTLGGGLGWWDGERWTHLDRRDGLPGDLAIDLDATDDAVWVATDGGLARVEGGRVTQTWRRRDGLPDDSNHAGSGQRDRMLLGRGCLRGS